MRAKKLEVEEEGNENKKPSFRRYSVSVRQEDFYLFWVFLFSLCGAHGHAYTLTCIGQESTLGVKSSRYHLPCLFWELVMGAALLGWNGWTGGPSYLSLCHAWSFYICSGNQTQVLILTWQALYKLSLSLGPQRVCFEVYFTSGRLELINAYYVF